MHARVEDELYFWNKKCIHSSSNATEIHKISPAGGTLRHATPGPWLGNILTPKNPLGVDSYENVKTANGFHNSEC